MEIREARGRENERSRERERDFFTLNNICHNSIQVSLSVGYIIRATHVSITSAIIVDDKRAQYTSLIFLIIYSQTFISVNFVRSLSLHLSCEIVLNKIQEIISLLSVLPRNLMYTFSRKTGK